MENKCVACGEEAEDGFALGKLCYQCIEETVIAFKKDKNTIKYNEFVGKVISDFYCNGFFGRDYDLAGAVIIGNTDESITIRKDNGELVNTDIVGWDAEIIKDYVAEWTK